MERLPLKIWLMNGRKSIRDVPVCWMNCERQDIEPVAVDCVTDMRSDTLFCGVPGI